MNNVINTGPQNGSQRVAPGLPSEQAGLHISVDSPGATRDIASVDLQPGDLLLMTAADRAYVAVFLGNDKIIEATGYGASIQPLAESLRGNQLAAAWRRRGLTPEEVEVLVRWLHTQEGRPYEPANGSPLAPGHNGAWYCSELILNAFNNIGKPLIEGTGLVLPGDAPTLTTVDYVGHLLRPGRIEPLSAQRSQPLGPFTPGEAERDAMIPSGSYGTTVDASILDTGDLIVVSSDHILSEAIRRRTNSPASHVALYIGDGEVIEAIGSGVEKRTLATVLNETHYAAAYRYAGLSDNEKAQIRRFAIGEWERGAEYDVLAIASLQMTQDDNAWFCSELVFAAFNSAGIRLGDPSQSTPGQAINMQGVEYLGHLPAQGDQSMSLASTTRGRVTPARAMQGGGTMAKLGYDILRGVVSGSSGDITFRFDELRGKYSVLHARWSEEEQRAHDAPVYHTAQMESRQSHWDFGTVSATVPISFQYNGHYIANLRLSRPGTDEHFAYSMDIAGEISENPNLFVKNGSELSRVDLRITHVIDYDWLGESFYDDTAEIIENYRIYSDGSVWCTVVVQGTWWFDASDARTPIRIQNGELEITGPHSSFVERIRQAASGAQALTATQPLPPAETVDWESESFLINGSGDEPQPVQSAVAASSSHRRRTRRSGSLSSGNSRIENAVQAAMRHGATEDEARAFFAHEAAVSLRGTRALSSGNTFPAISMVDSGGWIAGIIEEVTEAAFPASANPLQILFDYCTDNNLTIGLGLTAGVGFYDAADVGLGIVVAPGNRLGYYGSVSVGVGWNFEANIGVQLTVIDGGPSVFTGTSMVIGGSLDLSEGPSIGARLILNMDGNPIGWTAEVTWTIGVPVASAVEFTVSIQQTHAQFIRVRTQSLALDYRAPLIGGLPLRSAPAQPMAVQQNSGWANRPAIDMHSRRRIWA